MKKHKNINLIRTIKFLEELSWLLESRRDLNLKSVVSYLNNLASEHEVIHDISEGYKSPNPNKHFLIGVLPRLFQDKNLFPTNESIINFAQEVLNVKISRAGKRSRYEIIGRIVCETEALNDNKLSSLVKALSQIINSDEKLEEFRKERKNTDFSWNQTIQRLTS